MLYTQYGTTTISNGNSSVDVSLGTHISDLSKAFLLMWSTGDSGANAADEHQATGYLWNDGGTTKIKFERDDTVDDCQIGYMVVECRSEEFTVYRGSATITNGNTESNGVSIGGTIVEARSFIASMSRSNETGTAEVRGGFATAKFASTTTMDFKRGSSADTCTIRWEVVEWSTGSGVTVQSFEKSLSGNMSSGVTAEAPGEFTAVTKAETWLFTTFRHESNGLEQTSIRAELTDTDTITFDRYDQATSYQSYARVWLIEFNTSNVVVQHVSDEGASGDLTEDIPISAVTLANSFVWATNNCNGTGTAFPRPRWVYQFTSTTNVRATRYYSTQACQMNVQVIDTSAWSLGTTYTQTVTAKARIQKGFTQTVTSKARIFKTITRAVTAKGAIKKQLTQTVTAKGKIIGYISPATAQSLTIASPSQNITDATLTAVDSTPSGTTITYYLTADGGFNWEEVTSGVEHEFANPGQDLKWRAVLTGNIATSPYIETVSVDWVLGAAITRTKTITAKGRIQITFTKTIQAKGRIQVSQTQTVTAKGFIKKSFTKTLTSKGRIKKSFTQSLTVKARIQISTTQTITAKGRIQKKFTQTITSKARIQISSIQTLASKARITIISIQTIQAKTAIKKKSSQTTQAKATTLKVFTQTIEAKGRIQKAFAQTIQAKARIAEVTGQTIDAKANIKSVLTKTISAKASVKKSIVQTIQAKAAIKKSFIQTITAKARIQKSFTQTVTSKARITISTSQTIDAKANIVALQEQTIQAKAAILRTSTQTLTAKGRITISTEQTITAKASIKRTFAQTITALGRIQISSIQTLTAKAKITATTAQTINAKADIVATQQQTIQTKASLKLLAVARTIQTKGRIQLTTTKTIQALGCIQIASTQTLTAKAKIVCITKTVLVTPAQFANVTSPVYLVWEIPSCCKERNIHAHIQIDKTDNSFGDLEKDIYSFRDSDFEYWDGDSWEPYPTAGVGLAYYGNQARAQVTLTLGTKYWRARGGVK